MHDRRLSTPSDCNFLADSAPCTVESQPMRVVFLDRASLKAKLPKLAFAAEFIEHDKTDALEIVPRLAGAVVAITNKVPMRADTLAQLPQLKMIAVAATGYDM